VSLIGNKLEDCHMSDVGRLRYALKASLVHSSLFALVVGTIGFTVSGISGLFIFLMIFGMYLMDIHDTFSFIRRNYSLKWGLSFIGGHLCFVPLMAWLAYVLYLARQV